MVEQRFRKPQVVRSTRTASSILYKNISLKSIRQALRQYQDKKKAKVLRGFFKTGPGEYAEGDIFLGVTVPVLRKLAREFKDIELKSAIELLRSSIHEERLLALLILILKYRDSGPKDKEKIYRIYLRNTKYINNWDLVDVTAKHIVGDYLRDKDKGALYRLARSGLLWNRRIAIIATFNFIENQGVLQRREDVWTKHRRLWKIGMLQKWTPR